MTAYRRLRRAGASYFFTVALADRKSDALIVDIAALRFAVARTLEERPVWIDATVILPDHLHAVWTLPEGDADFSTRWRLIKSRFGRATGRTGAMRSSLRSKQERGLWQRRFWEHCLRDDRDFETHIRYCWGNPVKHGLVAFPADWPYSSIHRDIRHGRVDQEWCDTANEGPFGEPLDEWFSRTSVNQWDLTKDGCEHPSYGCKSLTLG